MGEAYFLGLSQVLAVEVDLELSFFDIEQFFKEKLFLYFFMIFYTNWQKLGAQKNDILAID